MIGEVRLKEEENYKGEVERVIRVIGCMAGRLFGLWLAEGRRKRSERKGAGFVIRDICCIDLISGICGTIQ